MLDRLREIYDRLTSGESTAEQAVQSGVWVTGINVGDRLLQLLKITVLANLLSPEAFGLLGIALLVLASFRQFSRLGFDEALIQHRDEDVDAYLNTAWTMKIGRAALIAAVAFVAAPHLASFFGEPAVGSLVRVLAAVGVIDGLQNPGVVYFDKNLDFHREFAFKMGGRVVDLGVAVAAALVLRSVWALILGTVAMSLVRLLLSYAIHDYRPTPAFDLGYAREMFGFGKWLFASSILIFLYSQGDDAFVGWFFSASVLGFYQIAYRFSNAPATEVTHVIARVAFPAFSKVQDDVDRLREGYFRVVQLSTTVAFPMAAGIIGVAPQFVHVVLGGEWSAVVPIMQLLTVWGALRAFGANVGAMYKAIGRPDIPVRVQALKVAILALTIYPAAEQFGILGVAGVVVGNSLVAQPVLVYITLGMLEARALELLRLVLYPLCGSAGMLALVVLVDEYVFYGTGPLQLVALVLLGAVSYGAFILGVEKQTNYGLGSLYREIRGAL
jgi:O-antigen/teichoic acid export membrane protein